MEREECHTNLNEYQLKDEKLNAVLPTTFDRLPTLSEIKVKLPDYCFRPSFRKSITYVIKDIFFVIFAAVLMYKIEHMFQYGILIWPVYWYIQGTIYMAFFVLGHDCGHESFSVYPLLNDTIGELWKDDVPWFADSEWTYVKGQLSTVDRHYGHVHSLIHSIGTHQIHHLFAKIPHYHLETATVHFRKAFPGLVRVKHNAILPSFIRMFKLFLRQRTIGQDGVGADLNVRSTPTSSTYSSHSRPQDDTIVNTNDAIDVSDVALDTNIVIDGEFSIDLDLTAIYV
ncbi:unnamed protein product [Rotaria magnacalcarata]